MYSIIIQYSPDKKKKLIIKKKIFFFFFCTKCKIHIDNLGHKLWDKPKNTKFDQL
jgi:hypothetical protein